MFDWLTEEYKLETSMLSVGNLALYNEYLPGKKHAPRLSQKIEDVHAKVNPAGVIEGKNYICLDVGACLIEDGVDVTMPRVKYTF